MQGRKENIIINVVCYLSISISMNHVCMNVTPPVKPCVRSKVGSMVKDRRSIHISTFDLRPSTIRTVVVVVASQPKLELIFAYSFRSVACDESTLILYATVKRLIQIGLLGNRCQKYHLQFVFLHFLH